MADLGVIALCSTCGHWTMFHADANGDTGREWTEQCRKAGDIIVTGDVETLRQRMAPHGCKCGETGGKP